jgi:hypothetical protein
MVTTRGKGRQPTHIDTAAAWQQQQQLAELRVAASSLPGAGALPVRVAHEVRRVLLLLRRRDRPNTTSSSSRAAGAVGMDVDAALVVAASNIRSLLQQLQPKETAAACVHAHLFAAWVRGVTAAAAAAAAMADSAVAEAEGYAAALETSKVPEATLSAAAATAPAAVRHVAGTSSTWGPISQACTLSSYQYGQLLLLLDTPGMLLDQLAWMHPRAFTMPWQQQQQQQQREGQDRAAAAQLPRLQMMLLADVCCAVPALAAQLLLQLPPQQHTDVAAATAAGVEDDGSSAGSSTQQLEPVPAMLLLCLCTVAGSSAGVAAFTSQPDKLVCLHVLSQTVQLLLPAAQQQHHEQQQPETEGMLTRALPQAVLQVIRNAAAASTDAQSSHHQQQQQQGLPSGNGSEAGLAQQAQRGCQQLSNEHWMQHDTCSVIISHQQLLAGLLQLLQDLLLQWGDTWYSSSSSTCTTAAGVRAVTVSGVQSQLLQLQQQLQQLLPQYLAAEQSQTEPAPQRQQLNDSSVGETLLQQLLPVTLSHQLLVHTNSRLTLTLMMMQMSGQQQPLSLQPAVAAAAASDSSIIEGWTAVCDDPFGRTAQQLLHCTSNSSREQQQANRDTAGSTKVENDSSSSSSHTTAGKQPCSWLTCFMATTAGDRAPSTGSSNQAVAGTAAADAPGPQLCLPCSFLPRQRQQQQQQQQQAGANTAAPVYTAAAQHSCAPEQQQQQLAGQAVANHLAGLAAAWLKPGYNLGPLLQPPTEFGSAHHQHSSTSADAAAPGTSSSSSSSRASGDATGLLAHVAAAAGTRTYGHLRVCCCLVQMLLHAVSLPQQQQQQQGCTIVWQSRCPGVAQLLLAMLAEATQQLEQPELQQALLLALHPTSTGSTTHRWQQQGSGLSLNRTLVPNVQSPAAEHGLLNPWAWLRQQLSAAPDLAAAASRGLVAASNKLVQASEEDNSATAAAGVVTRVVLPQQRREALLLAELSRVLLLYQLLWPELTARRLLLDAVQHRWVLQLQRCRCIGCSLHTTCLVCHLQV